MFRIALAQIASSTDKNANLTLAKDLVKGAKSNGASLIAFPEFLMSYSPDSQSAEELAGLAEPINGPFIIALRNAAKAAGLSILATIYERCHLPNRV